jgi:hypothetical protein
MSKMYTRITLAGTINPNRGYVKQISLAHTHEVILDSKDKLRFHLVGRLEMGTNSYGSNLVLSIIRHYLGF